MNIIFKNVHHPCDAIVLLTTSYIEVPMLHLHRVQCQDYKKHKDKCFVVLNTGSISCDKNK